MSPENKKICFTLDLEQDYGRINEYSAFVNISTLIDLFKKYNLKLTIFSTGKIIEKSPDVIKKFQDNLNCEIQLHSYEHKINCEISPEEKKNDLKKGIEAYRKYFGRNPDGYRAPRGNISLEEIAWLKEEGFNYDSSLIPTYRPGLFNNTRKNDQIFRHKNGLLEIPFSAIPNVKLPFSLSYLQLLGWPIASVFINKAKNKNPLVFGFHLHNLAKLNNLKTLKSSFRLFYIRNQNNGFKILEKFIIWTENNGYESATMSEINRV